MGMKQKIIAAIGGFVSILMGVIALVRGDEILSNWHSVMAICIGLIWVALIFVLRQQSLRKINIILSIIIVVFSVIEFVVPSFDLFYIGTGQIFYLVHKWISFGFGVVLLAISLLDVSPKSAVLMIICACLATSVSCQGQTFKSKIAENPASKETVMFPDFSFDILSDIHVYDTNLGTTGSAFEDYLAHDRKDLVRSGELFDTVFDPGFGLAKPGKGIVIISGDLTKDGEIACHELVAEKLAKLESQGKQVFVIDGNHDINNPDANKFEGETATSVPIAQPDDFRRIYSQFGYDEALERDSNSLSYVVEPVKGLRLLFVDTGDYLDNFKKGKPEINGKLSQARFDWVEDQLIKAREDKKAVIAVCHHGLIEHYKGQDKFFGDYLVDNRQQIGQLLVHYGVRTVFTGHYHATDITSEEFDEGTLFDIETGSLVSYPNSFRHVEIKNNTMEISTKSVTSLPTKPDYAAFSKDFSALGIQTITKQVMEEVSILGLKMNKPEMEEIVPQVSNAFLEHYAGDENFARGSKGDRIKYKGLSLVGKLVVGREGLLVVSLWDDLVPADKTLKINLSDGSVTK